MNKKLGIREILLLVIVFVVLFLIWFGFHRMHRDPGTRIRVSAAGELIGEYDLSEEQEIPIETGGDVSNILLIKDGEADMIWADCPDQTCVNTDPISGTGESIVCLPHQVVVEVISSDEAAEFDVIAQ